MAKADEYAQARKAFAEAIEASRVRCSEETADHYITMARMRHADPDQALQIALEYALRRGFMETANRIRAIIAS